MKKSLLLTGLITAIFMTVTMVAAQSDNPWAPKETITVKKGKTFNITVLNNGSTGYHWMYLMDPQEKNVKFVKTKYVYEPEDQDVEGKGGEQIFTFRAAKTGKTKIVLLNIPPSDNLGDADIHTVAVEITK